MIIVSWLGINNWFDDDWLSFVTLHIGNLGFFTPEQEGHSFLYFAREDMFSEIIYCLAFVSLYMIAFSKEKVEDEFVEHLRMRSLVWALKVNTIFFVIFTWFCFGMVYVTLLLLSMFSIFLLFHFRFLYELHRRRIHNEE
ncbi:hypothetical protein JCM17724A_04310 [Prevotella fusca JCM 17724]